MVWVMSNDWVLGACSKGGWMSAFKPGRSAGGGGWGGLGLQWWCGCSVCGQTGEGAVLGVG